MLAGADGIRSLSFSLSLVGSFSLSLSRSLLTEGSLSLVWLLRLVPERECGTPGIVAETGELMDFSAVPEAVWVVVGQSQVGSGNDGRMRASVDGPVER